MEEVCPGHPFIVFRTKPSVSVTLENPIPRSGLFVINSDISNGDTTKSFTDKIAKIVGLKGEYLNNVHYSNKSNFFFF